MATLQEYLNAQYPTSKEKGEIKEIVVDVWDQITFRQIDGGDLDLKDYKSLEKIKIIGTDLKTPLTKIGIPDCKELKILDLHDNNLTSVDFLLSIHNKLEALFLYNNDIKPTDIAVFAGFVNLRTLEIGITEGVSKIERDKTIKKLNRFHGSLASLKTLVNLENIDIAATDVDDGLKELPASLVTANGIPYQRGWKYLTIECSPYEIGAARCKVIDDALKPFDYDIESWQKANP